jgi:hypothetical protein
MATGTRMLQRRATAAEWATSDYVLADGELGVTKDTGIIKIGNGTSPWSELDAAFGSEYLPVLGTAANADLLEGISSSGFVKVADTTTAATADKVMRRLSDGRAKATTGTASDDLTNKAQMDSAISSAVTTSYNDSLIAAREEAIVRTVTSATTIATTDVGKMVLVNHSSLTAQVVVTIPTNATAAIPIGSWVDVGAIGLGGVKLTPAATVTLNGVSNVFPSYGVVRILKTDTNEWLGIALSSQKQCRLPKVRALKTTVFSGYNTSYVYIPYDIIDTVDTYNPDSEWFSLPPSGLPTGRRIIINKDGEYLITMHFNSSSGATMYSRINMMVNDNTGVGGEVLAAQVTIFVCSITVRYRATAGQSIGASHASTAADQTHLTGGNPHSLTITRLGD